MSNNEKERRHEISVAGEATGRMGHRVIGVSARIDLHGHLRRFPGARSFQRPHQEHSGLSVHQRKQHFKLPSDRRRVHPQESEYIDLVDAKYSGTWLSPSWS
ncbi:hypothetical protein ACFZAU_14755 [Streptomyces sp. NPDC008238]